MFEKSYRMLSFAPRWGIAPRHQRQTVAEHSFYVALYASQICDVVDADTMTRVQAIEWALRHDAFEAWTSDIPGPAKRSIVDPVKIAAYERKFAEENQDYEGHAFSWFRPLVELIVKAAGIIDEVFFLQTELALGNEMVRGLSVRSFERLAKILAQLDDQSPGSRARIFDAVERECRGLTNMGAVIPPMDTDLQ